MEPMGADAATGLPEELSRRGDGRAMQAGAARAGPGRSVLGRAPQQPDDRLAVHAGDGDDLVQELALLRPGGLLIPLSLSSGILSYAGSRHGALLRGWIGNRDF